MAITQGLKMLPLNNKIPSAIAAMMIVGMSFVSAHAFAAGGGKSSATSAIQDKDARKPIDRNDARRMLTQLSGRVHRVLTGVWLGCLPAGGLTSAGLLTPLEAVEESLLDRSLHPCR